ncbi:hypothetical protein [Halomarina litorea]|uniref:hypothetical protein n=1 Tax=Halomarina litorea TaxID=2961595 RepID=UPI0020C3BE6C|nr:hypothetical protein [Halomarina sp. BCD28]
MVKITLDVDDDLAARMAGQPHVDWDWAAERALTDYAEKLDRLAAGDATHDVVHEAITPTDAGDRVTVRLTPREEG